MGEPLYLSNRSGSRPSHEGAAWYLDQAAALCERAGFRKILYRGDMDLTQTRHLERWDGQGRRFIFDIDAMANLVEKAITLPGKQWNRQRACLKSLFQNRASEEALLTTTSRSTLPYGRGSVGHALFIRPLKRPPKYEVKAVCRGCVTVSAAASSAAPG